MPTPLGACRGAANLQVHALRCVFEDHQVSTTNKGELVTLVWEAFKEFPTITAQEFADFADISRYDAHAVLGRMAKRTKAGVKRLHVAKWNDEFEGARRYPRPVYAVGDKPDKPKPKPNVAENKRRYEQSRNRKYRMNSVFNMGLTRNAIRRGFYA